MRTRSLVAAVVAAALAGGCVTNPDPRSPSVEQMQRGGAGGWIVIHYRGPDNVERVFGGELIGFDSGSIIVLLEEGKLVAVDRAAVIHASLFKYESDWGLGLWTTLGTLSTISHGFVLILSAPVWMAIGGFATAAESWHVELEYPDNPWIDFAPWSRFPQGVPHDQDAILHGGPHRQPRTGPPGGAADAPPPPPPAPPGQADAWAETKAAAAAARANDCEGARAHAAKAQALDADFYATVTAKDVAIAACLAPPPPPPPPPPPAK